jgi:hypothetical protein
MSEQDVKTLCKIKNQLKNERRQLDRKTPTMKHAQRKIIAGARALQDFELTIRLRESTVNELKMLSWNLHQYRQTKTYDELVKFLIKSHGECRIRHSSFQ